MKNRVFYFTAISAFIALFNFQAQAQDSLTFSEDFRLNARAIGLGGSLVVQARDPSAIYWNPATLYGLKDRGMLISVNNPFTFNFVSVTQFVPLFGTFGIALSRVPTSSATIDRGTLAWGRKLFSHFSFGTKFDFLKGDDQWFTAAGLGLFVGNANVGVLDKRWRRFMDSAFLDKLSLGVTVHNIPIGERAFDPSAMFGLSYVLPVPGLLLNSGFHINKGEDTSHLGLGIELNKGITLFSGIEELTFDRFAVGMGYTRDNFVFNFAYSERSKKFLFTLAARISPKPSSISDRYYRKGMGYLRKRKYQQAFRQLQKYLDFELLDATSDSVRVLVSKLKTDILKTKSTIDSLFARSEFYLEQDDPKFFQAAYALIKIKELEPDNFAATVKLKTLEPAIDVLIEKTLMDGIAQFDAEQYKRARNLFDGVLIFDNDNETALDYMERITQIWKGVADEYFYRGIGYYRDKNYAVARKEFKKAFDLNPEKTEAKIYLDRATSKIEGNLKLVSRLLREGASLERRAKYVDATNKYLEVLKMDSENVEANVRLAKLKPKINRFIESKYTEGLQNYRSGNYAQAIQAFASVLSIDADHQNARRSLARVRKERKAKAMSYLGEAEAAFQRKEWRRALQKASKSLQLDSKNSKAVEIQDASRKQLQIAGLLDQGQQKNSAKKYLEAITIFENVLKMEPSNRTARTELTATKKKVTKMLDEYFADGINLYTLDRYEAAIALWNRVLELDPNHKGALEYKERATQRLQALKKIRR